jgi:branched-chain amino acid transport system ATP-binding protein
MEALRIENLSKSFGGVEALWDVSTTLEVGEKLAVIGPNGAGKTTLINLLNGQLSPTTGRILFFGKDITTVPTERRAHLGMARSFQVTNIFPSLTVLENTLLALGGTESSRIRIFRSLTSYEHLFAKAEEYLISADLWEKRAYLADTIGYGEQRKLEILFCLVSEPKLLLLDEPNCGLTTAESSDLVAKILELGEKIPAIIVSHDMDFVFGVADRIIVLHQGRIVADGLPAEIRADAGVKRIYMGIEEEDKIAGAG